MINRKPMGWNLKTSYFFYLTLAICAGYLIFEYFFIPYGALSADEFVFARHIYEYTYHLPYRDFPPYKAVLGYYLFSLPLFFSHGLLQPIFFIKDEIALINLFFIALSSYYLSRIFDKRAVLLALLAIIANQLFLVYSTDLRVDMLTSWMCFFSALCVIENRTRLGGFLFGVAFLVSQKALWYFIAINSGMLICWFTFASPIFNLRSLILFNCSVIFPIILYIIFWSLFSSPANVLYSLFYEAYIQSGIEVYLSIYFLCWQAVLARGPALFLLWPLTFFVLFDKPNQTNHFQRSVFIIIFSSVALLLFISYKQPFPYNFVFTIPALLLLYSDFFSWLFKQKPTKLLLKINYLAFIFMMAFYLFAVYAIIYLFALPTINLTLFLFPFALLAYFYAKKPFLRASGLIGIVLIFIVTAIAYPLYRSFIISRYLDGHYQQTMIYLSADILKTGGDYESGIPFLYNKDQTLLGMKNLIEPAIDYLWTGKKEFKILLLPSLYLEPATPDEVVENFSRQPIKIIINNYRLFYVPDKIRLYIQNNYQHFYGSIYLYASLISSGHVVFNLKFTDHYRIESSKNVNILLDGKKFTTGQIIALQRGKHISESKSAFRLALITQAKPLNANYKEDEWLRMIKAILA